MQEPAQRNSGIYFQVHSPSLPGKLYDVMAFIQFGSNEACRFMNIEKCKNGMGWDGIAGRVFEEAKSAQWTRRVSGACGFPVGQGHHHLQPYLPHCGLWRLYQGHPCIFNIHLKLMLSYLSTTLLWIVLENCCHCKQVACNPRSCVKFSNQSESFNP